VAPDASDKSLLEARRIAEEELRPLLETLPGVAAARVRGGLEREVVVEVHEALLHARGFTLANLVSRLQAENINFAGGSLLEGQTEYLIRTLNEFRGPEEMREIVLVSDEGQFARLGDIATVEVRPKQRKVIGRVGQREAVEVALYREADANIVSVSRRVKDVVFGTQAQQDFVRKLAQQSAKETESGDGGAGARSDDKASDDGTDKDAQEEDEEEEKLGLDDLRRARKMTAFLQAQLPAGMELKLVSDQARFIEAAIEGVRSTGLMGGVLAVLILFLFLRHGWSTFIISTAIPISVVSTFAPMYLFGVSLNLMSLGGLALVIGMLVDNSVVVLESVHRHREGGAGPLASAVGGTREVAGAVLASTLTTVAVFLPIAFVSGVAGQLFGHLALTVVFGLIASLAVALFLIPVLAALPERRARAKEPPLGASDPSEEAGASDEDPLALVRMGPLVAELAKAWAAIRGFAGESRFLLRPLRWVLALVLLAPLALLRFLLAAVCCLALSLLLRLGMAIVWPTTRLARLVAGGLVGPGERASERLEDGYKGLERRYVAVLRGALSRPSWILLPALVLFVCSLPVVPRLGTELLPEVHQGIILADFRFPVGTPLAETVQRLSGLEEDIRGLDEVDSVYLGAGAALEGGASTSRGENTAKMTVRLGSALSDPIGADERLREQIRDLVREVPSLTVELTSPALFSFRTPLEVEVRGQDLRLVREASDAAVRKIRSQPGVRDVRSNLQLGYPEIQIRYDRDRLSRFDLDIGAVASAVRDKVAGNIATDLQDSGRRTDVRVVLREQDRSSLEDLRQLNVNPRGVPPIPLDAVADLVLSDGPSEIRRNDQERSALVSAELAGFDLGTVADGVARDLASVAMDEGVRYQVGGQNLEMERSQKSLQFALLLAVFLVYIIMASLFESVLQPLIILFSLPLAIIGVVPALWATATPVSVVVLIGAIVLVGIVVNNAIVLVDCANRLTADGEDSREAIVEASRVRLRPILISTCTTVLGLLPMVLGGGEGSEIRQPLALTVIAGLVASTVLTLGVIPVLYQLVVAPWSRR
ncbi:MAG TPA: acriflavin resistance protein, partial [Deltaproteobacteria bacterium]|nr:acriflavin resistance protein [Deltaproteobacteria bacterium]